MIDTVERRIRRYIEDKSNFSNIVYDLSFRDFTAEKLINYIFRTGIVVTDKKKLKKVLDKYKMDSMTESVYFICRYICNASLGIYGKSYDLHVHMTYVSNMLMNRYFSEIIGDDVTLFLKMFIQECYAYIIGLKTASIARCPKCERIFVKTENRQKYCSKICGTNYRSDKYRKIHKKE